MRSRNTVALLGGVALALAGASAAAGNGAATLRTKQLTYTGTAGQQVQADKAVLRTKKLEYTGVAGKR